MKSLSNKPRERGGVPWFGTPNSPVKVASLDYDRYKNSLRASLESVWFYLECISFDFDYVQFGLKGAHCTQQQVASQAELLMTKPFSLFRRQVIYRDITGRVASTGFLPSCHRLGESELSRIQKKQLTGSFSVSKRHR